VPEVTIGADGKASGPRRPRRTADLKRVRLGAETDAEIEALVDRGIKFRDIFDATVGDPKDATYRQVARPAKDRARSPDLRRRV
jgi:hypothetical protein